MEDISAQSVGREFVRQYYTMLNERPESLHRFFSQNSSYVHGGIEKPGEEQPPVRGQHEIHQKIMSLDFKDCHAKIRQVDCQETVGNGVLIQVTGELSNDSGPMRRFMQTFVLARQAAKTFYVHNDIFRYQDEVFHDFDGSVVSSELQVQPEEVAECEPVAPGSHADHDGETINYDESSTEEETTPEVTAAVEQETEVEIPEEVPEPAMVNALPPADSAPAATETEGELKQERAAASPAKQDPVAEQLPVQKPFSWASLAGKNATPSGGAAGTAVMAPKPQAAIKPERKVDTSVSPQPLAQRPPRQTGRPGMEHTITDNNGETRKWPAYDAEEKPQGAVIPDNQQLFVGNLPHNVDDKELIEFFSKFGTVVDVKINRKGVDKNLPNFGFVSFDTPEAVGKTLAAKPLLLYNKHRLNVEEKKEQSELLGRPRGGGRGGRGMGPYRGSYRGRGAHYSANPPPVNPTSRQDNGTYKSR